MKDVDETENSPYNLHMVKQLTKIISGGQTGIDQMGLMIAQLYKIDTGGCAPKNFFTETGPQPGLKNYGLREVTNEELDESERKTGKSDRFTARTHINTKDSDGTVYFSSDRHSPGAKTTKRGCDMYNKPFIMNPNIDALVDWIRKNDIHILNIAGNRASKLIKRDAVNFQRILEEAIKIVNEIK